MELVALVPVNDCEKLEGGNLSAAGLWFEWVPAGAPFRLVLLIRDAPMAPFSADLYLTDAAGNTRPLMEGDWDPDPIIARHSWIAYGPLALDGPPGLVRITALVNGCDPVWVELDVRE